MVLSSYTSSTSAKCSLSRGFLNCRFFICAFFLLCISGFFGPWSCIERIPTDSTKERNQITIQRPIPGLHYLVSPNTRQSLRRPWHRPSPIATASGIPHQPGEENRSSSMQNTSRDWTYRQISRFIIVKEDFLLVSRSRDENDFIGVFLQYFLAVGKRLLNLIQHDPADSLQILLLQQPQQGFAVFQLIDRFECESRPFRRHFYLWIVLERFGLQPLETFRLEFRCWKWGPQFYIFNRWSDVELIRLVKDIFQGEWMVVAVQMPVSHVLHYFCENSESVHRAAGHGLVTIKGRTRSPSITWNSGRRAQRLTSRHLTWARR